MNTKIKSELEGIRVAAGGILRASDVVEFARGEATALHGQFEWDDTLAAAHFRLVQAGRVIRAVVTVIQTEDRVPVRVRAYMALPSDGAGYRATIDIIGSPDVAAEAVRMLQRDIERLRQKYAAYAALAGLLDEVSQRAGDLAEATEAEHGAATQGGLG